MKQYSLVSLILMAAYLGQILEVESDEKCKVFDANNEAIQRALQKMKTCFSENHLLEIKGMDDLKSVISQDCSAVAKYKHCLKEFYDVVQSYLPLEEKPVLEKIMGILNSLLEFACTLGGNNTGLSLPKQGKECLKTNGNAFATCFYLTFPNMISRKKCLPELFFSPTFCTDLERFESCVLPHFEQCSDPMPSNITKEIFQRVRKESDCLPQIVDITTSTMIVDTTTSTMIADTTTSTMIEASTNEPESDETCKVFDAKNETIKRAVDEVETCVLGNLPPTIQSLDNLDSTIPQVCTEVAKQCVNEFFDEVQDYLAAEHKPVPEKILRIRNSLIEFACPQGGDNIGLSLTQQGVECLKTNVNAMLNCYMPYMKRWGICYIELLFAPTFCVDLQQFESCILPHFEQCSDPMPSNITKEIFKRVRKESDCQALKGGSSKLAAFLSLGWLVVGLWILNRP